MEVSPEKFLGGILDLLLDGEFEGIADCYEEPMLVVRSNGQRALQDRETTIAELSAQAGTLAGAGAIAARIVDSDIRTYGGLFTLVDIHWRFLDRRAREVADAASTYVLRERDSGWKITAHITHYEQLARSAA